MKLFTLNESSELPENVGELEALLAKRFQSSKMAEPEFWEAFENPGDDLKHGHPCPKCGTQVQNKRGGQMSAPKFLGCRNFHAFPISTGVAAKFKSRSVGAAPATPEPVAAAHTCRFPPEDMHDSGRIKAGAKAGCESCKVLWDMSMDIGFSGGATAEPDEEDQVDGFVALLTKMGVTLAQLKEMDGEQLSDLLKYLILQDDKRSHHEPGVFGTGRPAKMLDTDSLNLLYLKMKQQEGMKGSAQRHRDRCTHGHTCGFYPNGKPAANYPLPDPQSTPSEGNAFMRAEGLTPGRFNAWFEYVKTTRRDNKRAHESMGSRWRWPVSGLMGWRAKPEYEEVVGKKYSCDVCVSRELGESVAERILGHAPNVEVCNNPVSQEYGKLKPFCIDHESESPYPKELLAKYGGVGLPDSANNPKRSAKADRESVNAWNKKKASFFKVGEEVRVEQGNNNYVKYGVGTITDIDLDMADTTHFVKWSHTIKGWFRPEILEYDLCPGQGKDRSSTKKGCGLKMIDGACPAGHNA